MQYGTYPITTINPSAIGAFDLNSYFRPRQWDERPESVRMKLPENDQLLLTILNRLPTGGGEWTNPIMSWRIDTRNDFYTTNAKAIASSDTYISLTTPYIVRPGYALYFSQYDVEYLVVDVDDDESEAWTNGAGDTCNVRVSQKGGQVVAIAAGSYARPGGPVTGERGEAKRGVTTTPGDPVYNFISMWAIFFDMSLMQINSEMASEWGTMTKEMENIDWQLSHGVQNDLLFSHRNTYNDADEDQVYRSSGIVEQLNDNVLDVGGLGNALQYANLVDFWDPLFESRLSSPSKIHLCGSAQFRDILKTSRDAGRLLNEPSLDTDLGANMYQVSTEAGRTVTVYEEKYTLQADTADWGITLDLNNLGFGTYRGHGKQWIKDIQANSAITTKSDALLMTGAVNVFDPSTMGVIRGGTKSLIAARQPAIV